MVTEPGKQITWGELHVGARHVFEDSRSADVSRPSVRRVVMRITSNERRTANLVARIATALAAWSTMLS
jgi:hypothetical protein